MREAMDLAQVRIELISELADFYGYYCSVKYVDEIPDRFVDRKVKHLNSVKRKIQRLGELPQKNHMSEFCCATLFEKYANDQPIGRHRLETQQNIDDEMILIEEMRMQISLEDKSVARQLECPSHKYLISLLARACGFKGLKLTETLAVRADVYATNNALVATKSSRLNDDTTSLCRRFATAHRDNYLKYLHDHKEVPQLEID